MAPNVRLTAAQFRGALDGLLEGVQILDRDLRYVYVNPAAASQGRQTVLGVVGRLLTEVFPGSETTEYAQGLREVLRTGVARRMRTDFLLGDGSVGHFDLSIEPIDEGVIVLSIENTEQLQAEAALADTLGRYRSVLEGLPDWVVLLDRNAIVLDLHVPQQFRPSERGKRLIGRSLLDDLPPALSVRIGEAFERALKTRLPQSLHYDYPMDDGPHHFETVLVPSGQDRVALVARDVSKRVELEHQLRQAQKMEAVGQLTGGIAHDFNNVLQVITANADLLAASADARGESPSPELADILDASHRGAEMIAQLLKFSRRTALARKFVEPGELLTSIARMLRRLLPTSVALELDPVPPGVTLSLDTGALEQIIANLCTNARDALGGGGRIHIRTSIIPLSEHTAATFPWLAPGDYFSLSVHDTGVGMTEETLQRVFEPFYTTKEVGVGTGLGMAMVYGLMKSHQGAVEVHSALGVGTEVRLLFPIVDAPIAADPESLSSGARRAPGGGETILLVEDDSAIRTVMRRVLELKGYQIVEAQDGASGLMEFRKRADSIRLVIADLVMPNLGGRQMADVIRAESASMPLLFTSGYTLHDFFGDAQPPAGFHFLPKPWTLTDLLTVVRRALDDSALLQDVHASRLLPDLHRSDDSQRP